MKIICLHHAGGSSFLYSGWEQLLGTNHVIAFDLPGHGKKMNQKPFDQYCNAIDYLYQKICIEVDEPYCVFGHSMGAEMIVHILERLENNNMPLPRIVFLSGMSSKDDILPASKLTGDELLSNIIEYGGISEELLETKEFLQYFFPVIRDDFLMIECVPEYNLKKKDAYKVYLFNGTEDTLAIAAEEEWTLFFYNQCEIVHFKGDHFYLANCKEEVCSKISSIINNDIV